MIARIKLAWWREQGLARGVGDLASELAVLSDASEQSIPILCRIVEGWDALVAAKEDPDALHEEYATGRGAALFELAALFSGRKLTSNQTGLGEAWALADLMGKLADPELARKVQDEAARRFSALDAAALKTITLPMGILAILARSDATRGAGKIWRAGSPIRIGRAALFALTRI